MMKRCVLLSILMAAPILNAGQLIVNGGFETGDFTGWTTGGVGSFGNNFYISSSTSAPVSPYIVAGPASGSYFAIGDERGAGYSYLAQNFTTMAGSSDNLSFSMFVDNYNAVVVTDGSLSTANQEFGVVQILAGGASLTNNSGVLATYYLGGDGGANNPYKNYLFNISSVVGGGGNFILEFGNTECCFFLQQGVDNVGIAETPEPATMALFGLGIVGFAGLRRWRKKA